MSPQAVVARAKWGKVASWALAGSGLQVRRTGAAARATGGTAGAAGVAGGHGGSGGTERDGNRRNGDRLEPAGRERAAGNRRNRHRWNGNRRNGDRRNGNRRNGHGRNGHRRNGNGRNGDRRNGRPCRVGWQRRRRRHVHWRKRRHRRTSGSRGCGRRRRDGGRASSDHQHRFHRRQRADRRDQRRALVAAPAMGATETAGVKPAANWNGAANIMGTLANLRQADGTVTAATVTWNSPSPPAIPANGSTGTPMRPAIRA